MLVDALLFIKTLIIRTRLNQQEQILKTSGKNTLFIKVLLILRTFSMNDPYMFAPPSKKVYSILVKFGRCISERLRLWCSEDIFNVSK